MAEKTERDFREEKREGRNRKLNGECGSCFGFVKEKSSSII